MTIELKSEQVIRQKGLVRLVQAAGNAELPRVRRKHGEPCTGSGAWSRDGRSNVKGVGWGFVSLIKTLFFSSS